MPTPGLYEHLLRLIDEQQLHQLGDPRLYTLAEVDAEERHAAVAQYLERMLAASLATFRGKEAADRQRRLVERLIGTLVEELGDGWADQFRLADPLRRLLAVHGQPREKTLERPDTPLSRSTLLTGTRLDPSLASQLRKESPADVRGTVQDKLRQHEINFIFVVDLYNEGVDIPEVDTVLLLRPTESLTVYLQQLGRGLRLHDGKECLTVLDFIGSQHRQFRFANRLRALPHTSSLGT